MKFGEHRVEFSPANQTGVALIVVLIVIAVLGLLAGGFAYSMRVETKLAGNTSFEGDLEWLGRSGVELARYVLVQHLNVHNEPWDSLNQKWAGGPLGTNEVLEMISLENNQLGLGTFSVRIVDAERKFNINLVGPNNLYPLQQALLMVGADPGDISTITESFIDWTDPNDEPYLGGSESQEYLTAPNPGYAPYMAKNGPLDDLSELLLVRGITPQMYWGPSGRDRFQSSADAGSFAGSAGGFAGHGSVGLVDLFTALSEGSINVNTASPQVLQLIPGIDPELAQGIVQLRAGWDGVDGTEDDVPLRSVGELINVPGMFPQLVQRLQSAAILKTRSHSFEVTVDARINQYKRQFVALVRRNPRNPRDVQTLFFHWK